jgi:hypothetical protein
MSSALDLSLDDIIASNKPAKGGRGGAGKGKPRGLQVKASPAIGKKPTRGAGPSVRCASWSSWAGVHGTMRERAAVAG